MDCFDDIGPWFTVMDGYDSVILACMASLVYFPHIDRQNSYVIHMFRGSYTVISSHNWCHVKQWLITRRKIDGAVWVYGIYSQGCLDTHGVLINEHARLLKQTISLECTLNIVSYIPLFSFGAPSTLEKLTEVFQRLGPLLLSEISLTSIKFGHG